MWGALTLTIPHFTLKINVSAVVSDWCMEYRMWGFYDSILDSLISASRNLTLK